MVVERYLEEVLNGHDLAALEELVADETLKQRVQLFLEAFPDLEVTTNLVVAGAELVAVISPPVGRTKGRSRACRRRDGGGRRPVAPSTSSWTGGSRTPG